MALSVGLMSLSCAMESDGPSEAWDWADVDVFQETPTELDRTPLAPDGVESVWFRGEVRTALRYGEVLLVEGDITVSSDDVFETTMGATADGVGYSRQAVRRGGGSLKWTDGVVPFDFSPVAVNDVTGDGIPDNFSPSQQATIVAAMQAWQDGVPGLTFRPATSADGARIRFVLAGGNNSFVGRQGNTQIINLSPGGLTSFTAHHEIGHALGFYHQQNRTDRNSYLAVQWPNIQGCLSTATGPTPSQGCGSCNSSNYQTQCGCPATAAGVSIDVATCNAIPQNFAISADAADILAYDCNSIMQYPLNAFAKASSAATLATTVAVDPVGNACTPGQRSGFGPSDLENMRVLYPVVDRKFLVFQNTGAQPICNLRGRESDVATAFTFYSDTLVDNNGILQTNSLPENTVLTGAWCRSQSIFWDSLYAYPNAGVYPDFTFQYVETLDTDSGDLVVRSAGLIPVLFG